MTLASKGAWAVNGTINCCRQQELFFPGWGNKQVPVVMECTAAKYTTNYETTTLIALREHQHQLSHWSSFIGRGGGQVEGRMMGVSSPKSLVYAGIYKSHTRCVGIGLLTAYSRLWPCFPPAFPWLTAPLEGVGAMTVNAFTPETYSMEAKHSNSN